MQEIDKPHDETNHSVLLISKLLELKRDYVSVKQSIDEKDIKIQQLENKSIEMHTKINSFREEIHSLSVNLKGMGKLVESLQKELAKLKYQPSKPQFPLLGGGARLKKDVDVVKSKVTGIENKYLEVDKAVT